MSANRKTTRLAILSGRRLAESFFGAEQHVRLHAIGEWERLGTRKLDRGLRAVLAETDALITTWDSPAFFPEELTDWAPKLRIIAHCGASVKTRFAPSLFDKLTIVNAPGPMSAHVAELAVAFLLYYARGLDRYPEMLRQRSNAVYQSVHRGGVEQETLFGQEIGLIGYGRIGKKVVELLAPFGVSFRVYDPLVATAQCERVRMDSLEAVLKNSKHIILAAAQTEETTGMLNRRRLQMLPRQAVVINIARGSLVDLPALTELVLKGRLRCALDVTDPDEPLPIGHPLRRARGAILTPHVGAISRSVRREIADELLSNLESFFGSGEARNRVTSEALDRTT